MPELAQMLRRQQVLADFGDFVLRSEDLDAVLTEACRLVGAALGTDRAKILQAQEDGRSLFLRAGVGWEPDIIGRLRLSTDESFPEVVSFRTGLPVVSRDVREEERFAIPAFMREAGVLALASVPILLPGGRSYGLLQVDAREPREFGPEDIQFLRTYATILGPVIDRLFQVGSLREHRERFRLTVEAVRDHAIIVTDPQGRITDWLPGAEAVFGWSAATAVGQSGSILFTAGDRENGEDGKELETARTRGVAPDVRWHVREDGSRVFIDGSVRALRDGGNGITGFIRIGQDVTERRRSDCLLRASEARLRTLLEGIPQLVWRSSDGERWTWAGPQWSAYTGQDDADSHGLGWLDALHPADRDAATAGRHGASANGLLQFDCRIRHAGSGRYHWFQTRGVPVRDEDGRIAEWLGTCTDIDDQVRAREVLARSGEELERTVSARTNALMAAEGALRQSEKLNAIGQLTSGVAHDFNNLLQALSSCHQMLRMVTQVGAASDAAAYVDRAEDIVERAGKLVRRMLTFAREGELEPRPLNVDGVMLGLEDLIRRTVGPSVRLELRLRDGSWLTMCDPNQFESALLNLCINARDAMPDGGWLTVGTEEVVVGAEQAALHPDARAGRYVSLSVRDTGTGIPADVIDRVFEPFFTTKPIGAGTGLGLSQIHGFVHQSGGFVEIDTETEPGPRRGTTVRLHFPFHSEDPEGGRKDAVAGTASTVLLVEDEADIRELTGEFLRSRGLQVLEAESGAAATRLIESGVRVDVLVTDQGLPGGMTGVQLIALARKRHPDLPTLLVTGSAEPPMERTQPMLRKPFKMTHLAAVIEKSLSNPARG